jgi:hypothetical protein
MIHYCVHKNPPLTYPNPDEFSPFPLPIFLRSILILSRVIVGTANGRIALSFFFKKRINRGGQGLNVAVAAYEQASAEAAAFISTQQ